MKNFKKIVTVLFVIFYSVIANAVEVVFSGSSYEIPEIFFWLLLCPFAFYVAWSEIKALFYKTRSRYENATLAITISLSYIVIPFAIFIVLVAALKSVFHDNDFLLIVGILISGLIALFVQAMIKVKFSK